VNSPSLLHRFATLVAGCTVLLVLAGSLVTSTGSGLSVPDWPTSYGWNMFSFPPSQWGGGILYEHGHRLIASTVGFLTIILAAWLALRESRRWMKWLGAAALGAVIAQGVLGGLTVLFFLPAAISTAHAGLAEIFFCMTVAIALFTSPRWIAGYIAPGDDASALDNGGADSRRTFARDKKNLGEDEFASGLSLTPVDDEAVALPNPELMTAVLKDCVHPFDTPRDPHPGAF